MKRGFESRKKLGRRSHRSGRASGQSTDARYLGRGRQDNPDSLRRKTLQFDSQFALRRAERLRARSAGRKTRAFYITRERLLPR